ncbi:cupin domain-containing protein [Bacteroidota bacterium]
MMKVKKPSQEEINETDSWGTWGKEPSKFPWYYDDKETCFILEGQAVVTDKSGNQISFEAGDYVEFEQGLECTWEILKTIKKKYKFG